MEQRLAAGNSRRRENFVERAEKFLDRALAVFSPKRALQRQNSRLWLNKFNYEAARPGTWRQQATLVGNASADTTTINYDRIRCIWEVRDLENNFPFTSKLLDMYEDYVLGDYRVKSKATSEADRKAIDDYWDLCSQYSDPTGRFSFLDQTHLSLRSATRDGDVIGRILPEKFQVGDREMEFLQVTIVEADRIGYPYEGSVGNGYLNGVLYDPETGYIKGYRIFQRDPMSNTYSNPEDVSSSECLYVSNHNRADQLRAPSRLAPAIPTMRDIMEIIENERLSVKWCASQGGVVTRLSGDTSTDNDIYPDYFQAQLAGEQGAQRLTAAAPASIQYLAPGEKFEAFNYSRPSPAFQGLLDTLYRDVCLSLSIPFGFAYKATTNGVASRLESAQARRAFMRWQRIMRDKWIMPFRNRALLHGLETGQLQLSPQGEKEVLDAKIIWPAHPTVDVGRESQANVAEYNANLKAGETISEERGDDYDEMMGQISYEKRMEREKIGLAESVVNNFGPKGLDGLFQIYGQVSSGAIPPKNARLMLQTLFALSPEEAEKAIPDSFKVLQVPPTPNLSPNSPPKPPAQTFKLPIAPNNKSYEGAPNLSDEEEMNISNSDWLSKKIKILVDEGYEQDQAVAIAESMNRDRKKSKLSQIFEFDGPEDEARDEHGRWTSGGGEKILGTDELKSPATGKNIKTGAEAGKKWARKDGKIGTIDKLRAALKETGHDLIFPGTSKDPGVYTIKDPSGKLIERDASELKDFFSGKRNALNANL
jgi:capsid protein